MKVTIDFGEELDPVIQYHLETQDSVQQYIQAAVVFYNEIRKITKDPKMAIGYGEISRMAQYHKLLDIPSPKRF